MGTNRTATSEFPDRVVDGINVLKKKLVTVESFLPSRERFRAAGKKLVWTNGCFDLIHPGHILYLQCAKEFGDFLLVGLNSDRSFRLWKRRPGPIQDQENRALILCSLQMVDFVLIFDEPSPATILSELQPDIYVKGSDYSLTTIDQTERRVVETYGGEIRFCQGMPGHSTTNLIQRILTLYSQEGRK